MLLEAMGVHAQAAAVTGQLAMSELAMLELVVSEEECCDVLSARTDGSLWHSLVARWAWSDERYAAWLSRFWIAVLVKPTSLRFTGSTTPGVVPGLNRLARPVRPSSCQRAPSSASCHRACRCPVWSSPNRWPLERI